ncbi:TPA: ClpP-like prohead protease/major capsid protein fusion protein [Stenotrophomonas maltophilia]|uniref:ClpP-like prohead protease/major capsid protein fusion protein n=1 Tax=Stenotrophomonas maltophilia TaxID=40324 RepID=UPI000C14F5DF|nr:ClpP-like prohead protease/major capsid protein fusion protein [Stenotrophomonas maltophilia]MBN5044677.1 ATP-dependent Clp protease proteolytic subunit [Stenotrophomonas maltophilia]HDS1367122.1 ATP-dependent Clp protease proteolytic subunit [Stenotrophomonas maltophilia]HDS1371919.1 ATP-dependent Clp protease proteolytic subunit [Stenotrophomonas maltophilia]HDS1376643.1 ATP-dependent Clp protease proteolytic subunit [Stenotrophomonas maltophilia]HDS1381497.1 ATP-dependent Clp protease pr
MNTLSLGATSRLAHAVLAATFAFDSNDIEALQPEAKGKSVLALNTTTGGEAELLIYGPIGDYFWGEGVTAASVVEQLAGTTASVINVRINSDGGVVTDGLAIYNALKQHPATINVTVDGVAASIASLIAMAGSTRRMHENTMLMLHGPQGGGWGFAGDLRERADQIDVYGRQMLVSYSGRAKNPADIETMLTDRRDHWLTASEALALGLVSEVIPDVQPEPADSVAAAALLSYVSAISGTEGAVHALLRKHIQATTTASAFASLREVHQRAVVAHLEETSMKQQCQLIMAQAGTAPAASTPAAPASPAPATPVPPVAAAPVAAATLAPAATVEQVIAAISARNAAIRTVFAGFREVSGVQALEAECLADAAITEDVARGKLLAKLAASGQPLAGGFSITDVVPEEDNQRRAQVNALLARAGVLTGADAESARNGNPYAHTTLLALAERSLIQAGVNTRGMDREQIARGVLAVQTTSDFPVLLENVLHRVLVGAYNLQQFTWTRFCATGTLSDYRPHSRYHLSSFSDLKPVNEAGEYENGVLGDGEVETIKGARKGRILQITPEVLVNDDLGAFVRITTALGQAAGRTIEKDVYDVLKQNSGLGPVMKDGHTLFHAEHGNIAPGAAVSVDAFDAMRQLMALQMDPGGNDYLDISLSRFLGTVAMHGRANLVNNSEYNPDVTGKFQVNNTSRATFSDIITSPRLGTGKGWYGFADPNVEPVIEVAFLNGVQTPVLEQETNFRTDGLSWKVVHKYGVGAVGWRGAAYNPGE